MKKHGSLKDFQNDLSLLRKNNCSHLFIFGNCEYLEEIALESFKQISQSAGVDTICSIETSNLDEARWIALFDQQAFFEPATLYLLRRSEQSKLLTTLLQTLQKFQKTVNRTCFIYRSETLSPAIRNTLNNTNVQTIACLEPWPNEIPILLGQMAQNIGLELTADARDLLIEACGTNPSTLFNELSKIKLISSDSSGPITAKVMAPYLGVLREDDAFTLANLLLAKQWSKAHALVVALLARGESPLALVGIIANHCRNAVKISAGAEATEIRLPPSIYKNYRRACHQQSPKSFLKGLERCRQVDMLLKSTSISDEMLVTSVIDALT